MGAMLVGGAEAKTTGAGIDGARSELRRVGIAMSAMARKTGSAGTRFIATARAAARFMGGSIVSTRGSAWRSANVSATMRRRSSCTSGCLDARFRSRRVHSEEIGQRVPVSLVRGRPQPGFERDGTPSGFDGQSRPPGVRARFRRCGEREAEARSHRQTTHARRQEFPAPRALGIAFPRASQQRDRPAEIVDGFVHPCRFGEPVGGREHVLRVRLGRAAKRCRVRLGDCPRLRSTPDRAWGDRTGAPVKRPRPVSDQGQVPPKRRTIPSRRSFVTRQAWRRATVSVRRCRERSSLCGRKHLKSLDTLSEFANGGAVPRRAVKITRVEAETLERPLPNVLGSLPWADDRRADTRGVSSSGSSGGRGALLRRERAYPRRPTG